VNERWLGGMLTNFSTIAGRVAKMQEYDRMRHAGDFDAMPKKEALILTRELYEKFPTFGEGPLTKARAKLVNRRALAERGRQLDLGRHLLVSRGEENSGGRERASALADGYEAVVGAVFLDGGFEVAREFILREFHSVLSELAELPNLDNPKGELQELLQAVSPEAPQYHVVSATGPDHDRIFECTVHHAGVELARGSGKSKKLAESEAALAALQLLRPNAQSKSEQLMK